MHHYDDSRIVVLSVTGPTRKIYLCADEVANGFPCGKEKKYQSTLTYHGTPAPVVIAQQLRLT